MVSGKRAMATNLRNAGLPTRGLHVHGEYTRLALKRSNTACTYKEEYRFCCLSLNDESLNFSQMGFQHGITSRE
jgi:hypothetical protein